VQCVERVQCVESFAKSCFELREVFVINNLARLNLFEDILMKFLLKAIVPQFLSTAQCYARH